MTVKYLSKLLTAYAGTIPHDILKSFRTHRSLIKLPVS